MIESTNLKSAAAKGLFWSAMERFGAQGIQFVFGIWLTRILDKSDYGLLGMILIFMAVGQTLIDSGFGSALIWKKSPSRSAYSTVFYFNISVSLILYILFYFLAPWVADFYNEPQLIDLIRVISLNFIILSFSLIQQTILQKRVDFKLMAYVNFGGSVIAGIVALVMAMQGFGVWSIVWQILIKSFVTSVFLWIFSSWRPLVSFDFAVMKELFGYGSKLTAAGLIYAVFQNLYFNIIGKLFPIESLGLYTRAAQLQEFPVKTITSALSRVAFPVFSTIKNENERLKNAVRKTTRTLVFILFPVLLGLIAVSDLMIKVVLTEKWLPASGYFKLLCLVGLIFTFQVVNAEIFKTKGKSKWVLNLEIANKIILVLNIFITYKMGISAIIIGQIIIGFISYLIGAYCVSKLIDYSIWQQWKDLFLYLIASLGMFLLILPIPFFINNSILALTSMILIGIISYSLFSWSLKIDEFNELKIWKTMIK